MTRIGVSQCGCMSNKKNCLVVYEYLNLTFKLISHNIIKPLGKSYILCN